MQQRALGKALTLGLHKRVVRVAYGRYEVPSTTTGERYTVTHNPGQDEQLYCTCPGRSHPACIHRASVWLAKQEAKGVRVTSPARKEAA
jgi:hypothetical protein